MRWEWSSSISLDEQPRLKPEQIRMGHPTWPDGALMVRRDQPHSWVKGSIPYFRRDPWAKVFVSSAEHARSDGLDLPLPPLAKDGNYGYLAQLGLDQRFRELQNHRPALGGLCRRPSTSDRAAKAMPARSGTRPTKSRPTGEASPTRPGRCGRSAASSTTSHPGSSSAGSRSHIGGDAIGGIGVIALTVFFVFNLIIAQGLSGRTFGKFFTGTRCCALVTTAHGDEYCQYPGIGVAFARTVSHVIDMIFLWGWLRPLWQQDHRTFADSAAGTVVVMDKKTQIYTAKELASQRHIGGRYGY